MSPARPGLALGNRRRPGEDIGGTARERPAAVRSIVLSGLIFGFLALLGSLEAGASPPAPLAAIVSIVVVFGLLCLMQLEIAFLMVLAVTPFSIETIVPGTGSALQVPTEPMLFVALGVWFVRSLVRRPARFGQVPLTLAFVTALAALLVSVVFSPNRFDAFKATLNASWYGLFGLFLINNFADDRRLRWMPWALLLPASALCLYSLGNVAVGHYRPLVGYFWGEPFFIEHGTFSAYLSFACALALGLAIESTGALKLLLVGIGLLTGAQVVLSMTRGAWMGLAGLALFLVFTSWRRLARLSNLGPLLIGTAGLVAILAGAGAVTRLQHRSETITDRANVSNLERLNRWAAAWAMFRSAPLTGIGYGTYSDSYLRFRSIPLSTEQSANRMGVHSEYLRVLSEAGLLGAVTSAIALFLVLRIAARVIRHPVDTYRRGLAVGLTGGLVTYMVHATVNNYMGFDKLSMPVWASVGVLAAIDTFTRRT